MKRMSEILVLSTMVLLMGNSRGDAESYWQSLIGQIDALENRIQVLERKISGLSEGDSTRQTAGAPQDGGSRPYLALQDASGHRRIMLVADSGLSAVSVLDQDKRLCATIVVGKVGPVFYVYDEKGTVIWSTDETQNLDSASK